MPSVPVPPEPSEDSDEQERGRDETRIGARDLTTWRTSGGRVLHGVVAGLSARLAPLLRWSVANLAFVVTVLVGGVFLVGSGLLAGEVYEAVAESDGLAGLDQPVLETMVGLRSPGLDQLVTWFTNLGGTVGMPVIASLVTLTMSVRWRSWTPVVLMSIGAAGSLLLTVVGKDLVGRARPPASLAVAPLESSPSFPSGHTLNATVLIGLAAYLLLLHQRGRAARVLTVGVAALLIIAMGLSRVYLGHHWLTDVVAAWLLGVGWLAAVITGHRIQLTLRRHPPGSPGEVAVPART